MEVGLRQLFTLPHRDETRGVGGVFFDRLTGSFAGHWSCVADGLAAVLPAYLPILRRRHAQPFTEREWHWQLLRRGRYVEFNLVPEPGSPEADLQRFLTPQDWLRPRGG